MIAVGVCSAALPEK